MRLFRGTKEKGKAVIQRDLGERKGGYSEGLRRRESWLFRGIKKEKLFIQKDRR
jgi:hypothetical protein